MVNSDSFSYVDPVGLQTEILSPSVLSLSTCAVKMTILSNPVFGEMYVPPGNNTQ